VNDAFADPSDTREEILAAAYRALCAHGYADLTIQRIGDEFEKSPSLVYHHYDGKDELLVDLLGYLLDLFADPVADGPFELSARERLDAFTVALLAPERLDAPEAPDARLLDALVELRAQAVHDDAYRDHFERSDRVFREFLDRTVREAAAEARTDDAPAGPPDAPVPAAEVTATIQTLTQGGMTRRATTDGDEWVDEVRAGLDRYLDATLPRVAVDGDPGPTE